MEWKTTSTLLQRLHDFEEGSAWNLFVDHFREPIVRFGLRMGLSRAEAEDAAQETLVTFTEAYRARRYDPAKGRLKSWLFGIANRHARNARRRVLADRVRKQADLDRSGDFAEVADGDPETLGEWWEEEWSRAIYERALRQVQAQFSPQTLQVFQLVVFDEKSAEDVAEALGMDRAQVYDAKYRVTKRLTELVRKFEDA